MNIYVGMYIYVGMKSSNDNVIFAIYVFFLSNHYNFDERSVPPQMGLLKNEPHVVTFHFNWPLL